MWAVGPHIISQKSPGYTTEKWDFSNKMVCYIQGTPTHQAFYSSTQKL